jgi:hypothetical protein
MITKEKLERQYKIDIESIASRVTCYVGVDGLHRVVLLEKDWQKIRELAQRSCEKFNQEHPRP